MSNTSLSRNGYSIIKEEHKSGLLNEIRKELTVKPFIHKNYAVSLQTHALLTRTLSDDPIVHSPFG